MMNKISPRYYSIKNNVFFVLFASLFAMFFAVIYVPTYGLDVSYWHQHDQFFVPILSAIILVALVISRAVMVLFTRENRLSIREFVLWQIGEFVACMLFCNLFISLYAHIGYFRPLARVLMIGISIEFFPYVFYVLFVEMREKNDRVEEMRRKLDETLRQQGHGETEVIQFFDDKNNAKFMVGVDKIYSVESAGNYVNIVYEDEGRIQRYSVRNSMKGVERVCEQGGLVRCHRSYYINLRKIKLIRKDSTGTYAQLQNSALSDIPISKNYAAEVAQLFSTGL